MGSVRKVSDQQAVLFDTSFIPPRCGMIKESGKGDIESSSVAHTATYNGRTERAGNE